jgi:hypothetical protein
MADNTADTADLAANHTNMAATADAADIQADKKPAKKTAEKDDDRWTVRGVPEGIREAANAAMKRVGLTQGAYIAQAIDRNIQAEREPFEVSAPGRADKLSAVADIAADVSDTQLARVERVIAAAVALASTEAVPPTLRRHANRLLKASLPPPPPVKRLAKTAEPLRLAAE